MARQSFASVSPPSGRVKKPMSRGLLFVIIAVTLGIGFILGTRSDQLLAAVGPVFGIKVPQGTLDLSRVQATYRQLSANFDGELNSQALIDGASRGLVAAAGDPYTAFFDAEEAEQFSKDLAGDIGGGIGAEIGIRSGQPTIIRALPGNPAEAAGVRAGDVIVGVNDQPVAGWTADKTAQTVRGEVGTTVKLSLMRGNEPKELTITRAAVTNPSVTSKVEGNIGYLTLSRFDDQTGAQARAAADDFKRQNVRGVVLDLRGNGGGYLSAAQELASLWLKSGTVIVTERTGGKTTETLTASGPSPLQGVPTTVLINAGSASASEIVAGALKDHKAATLIGEKTYGKGTVQNVIQLGGGTQLKVTIARWYTPGGRNITQEGIAPDQNVALTQTDLDAGSDPQLAAARTKLGN